MPKPAVPKHIHENIETIAELKGAYEHGVGRHQRAIEACTRVLGRPATVYTMPALVGAWVLYNAIAAPAGWRQFDGPPFFWLQGVMSAFGALVATMVLTTQNRQNREAEQRAHLELQVNLLAEQKATKIIALIEELRRDMPSVKNRRDLVAERLQEHVDPRAVLSALESTMESPPGAPLGREGNKE